MKKLFLSGVFLFFIAGLLTPQKIYAQRNPVLEFCTGTWCGWCPCGHSEVEDNILPQVPNAIIIAYHGANSDPFKNFSGNQIIGSLFTASDGYVYYPTGIADRTSAALDFDVWHNYVIPRAGVPPTVDISIYKTYDASSRALNVTLTVTPLSNLSGTFKVNLILLENGLIANQSCFSDCCSPSGTQVGYVHDHVVRNMINGYLGETLNSSSSTWTAGDPINKTINYSVPSDYNSSECDIVAIVYKSKNPLYQGEIQQAMQWTLEGNITPVELTSFSFYNDANGVNLVWATATETNNQGFQIERKIPLNPSPDKSGQVIIKGDAALAGGDWKAIGFVQGAGTTTETQNYFFRDEKPSTSAKTIYYRLKQIDYDGTFDYSKILTVEFDTPQKYELAQNYPNPFNPLTRISYSIMKEGHVKLFVYDIMGRQVAALVDEVKEMGNYDVMFDASQLASGTYVYSLVTPEFSSVKKMIILK
ncbi:MAG: Omp28-related outer membrane protein [bacterium]